MISPFKIKKKKLKRYVTSRNLPTTSLSDIEKNHSYRQITISKKETELLMNYLLLLYLL